MVLGVSDHGSSLGVLDNGLSLDSHGDGDVVRGINTTLNQDGVLHVVDLNLLLDDGGVVGNRSLQDSGDTDGKMRGGRLVDGGGVSRDEVSGAIVHLLGDHGSLLVDGGDSRSLSSGGVRSRGRRSHIVDRVGHHRSSLQGVGGKRSWAMGLGHCCSNSVGNNTVSCNNTSGSHNTSSVGGSSHG